MRSPKIAVLDFAFRVFPVLYERDSSLRSTKTWACPDAMLVLDTETLTDETQRLTFGSYRFIVRGQCLEEGLFYADELLNGDRAVLEKYVKSRRADTTPGTSADLLLLLRTEFVRKLFHAVYRSRCLLVGFNLPFDLSRIAHDFGNARGRFAGGFSLELWHYRDSDGVEHASRFRPRICIKHIDSKRALKAFTGRRNPDRDDLIPEDSESGEPEDDYVFHGHFLDLRTLAFSLTDQSYTLEAACKAFGVEHGKASVTKHGIVTDEYIDYNRRDVLATAELAAKLLAEFDKHPITLQATKAYSPASLGKAYLRAIEIEPILKRQPDFPRDILGYAASAFFGGRTSAHIRKSVVPVVYVDFLSMYPTVNSLMDLWPFVVAEEIRVARDCRQEIQEFLAGMTTDALFDKATWKKMTAFVKIKPDGDILPNRSKYSSSNDWQVAVNHLYCERKEETFGLWFTLPDVVASVLLTGTLPHIVDAFRIEPVGTQAGLRTTKLYGQIEIDPAKEDFFRVAIEQRKRLSSRTDLSQEEKGRLDKALKVLANSTSYGIYAEMNRQESDEPERVTCHGIDRELFQCRVAHPDVPGEYCFPPLASLITGGARLMLALLERCIIDRGGTYAMEDTDSMAIVATKRGGLIECPGSTSKGRKGNLKTLSWREVEEIAKRFEQLNPYDRSSVPGSVLKIEDDNFDRGTDKQRQLYCYAISAKRYTLFLRDKHGEPVLLRKGANNKTDRWSQHGLGHLLNPIDPESEDRDWIGQVWLNIVRRALGLSVAKLRFDNLPAVGRVSVSSPAVMRAFTSFNKGKGYADRIKPFNFVLTCQVLSFGYPSGVDPERFHLIAPYNSDSRRWLKIHWTDQYASERYRITADGHHGGRKTARVKTYGEILLEYEYHPESKCANADSKVCDRQTVGLLTRRHVQIDLVRFIGKESNVLEEVDAGLVHSADNAYTEYCDPKQSEWEMKILPLLKSTPLKLLTEKTGISRRALLDLRAGRSTPRRRTRNLVVRILQRLALTQRAGCDPERWE